MNVNGYEANPRADLGGIDLRGVKLSDVDLHGVIMELRAMAKAWGEAARMIRDFTERGL